MNTLDIKFGFADSPRELVITSAGEQEQLRAQISQALENNSILELEDDKGRKYIVRTDRIIYVEVGAVKPHAVGFAGV